MWRAHRLVAGLGRCGDGQGVRSWIRDSSACIMLLYAQPLTRVRATTFDDIVRDEML